VPPEFVLGGSMLALLLAVLGAFLLLLTHRQRGDVLLALALGSLAVSAVASVLWLGSDTSMLCAWLAVALFGLVLAIWRLRRHAPLEQQ